jgi:predicted PurR-regulated permease PerM
MGLFKNSEVTINITTETIVKGIILTVLAVLALQFMGNVAHQLRLIIVSLFLALALNPAVTWLTIKLRSKSRIKATGVAYLVVLTVLTSFLALVVPPLIKQTTEFLRDVPQTIADFKTQDTALSRTVKRYGLDEQLDSFGADFEQKISKNLAAPVVSTANRVLGTLISMVTVLVLTFMMLVEGPAWITRFISLQPIEKQSKRKRVLRRMYRVVTSYVNGQVFIAAIGAAFAMVALFITSNIFNAEVNEVALAGIVFMFSLLPLIGTTIGAAVIVLFTLLASVPMAIAMAVYFLIYQQIENATLQPYIQAKTNQLTPLIIFVAALLGVGFGGLLGALAAIPIAGCVKIILEEKYPRLVPTANVVANKEPLER